MLSLSIYLFVRFKFCLLKKKKILLIFKVLVLITQGDQISNKSIINPDIEIKNCTFGEICTGAINSNFVHFYSVEYSFDPTMVRKNKTDEILLISVILSLKKLRI
jgi:hypothetical protein